MIITFRLSALGFGGTERVFLSVADYLSTSYGYSIHFVVDKVSGHETEQVAIAKGYRLVGLGAARSWKTVMPFSRYLCKWKPGIVISAYTETNAAALIAKVLSSSRTPIIITEHAPIDEHWSGAPWLRKQVRELLVRYVYKLADRVSCVSRGMMQPIARRLNHPHISYIHNPVRFAMRLRSKDEARRRLGVPTGVAMLLAVGRVSRAKNYLMLLQSLRRLVDIDGWHLFIVGGVFEADEKSKLDQFIDEFGLADRLTFVGFTHEVNTYYEAADLLVLSSAWEGFGNVLVEGMAFGLPVVSTRCNYGPAEILADGKFGVLVDVDDYTAMAAAIEQVLTNNPFLPERQVSRAQDFSEQRIGEAYYQLICETLQAKT
ncbi:MAG: hypothetical protein H6R13_3587 [Proteobacteria bacterium]|nr:hypothetical protein [Pseudomonadota bacterium]